MESTLFAVLYCPIRLCRFCKTLASQGRLLSSRLGKSPLLCSTIFLWQGRGSILKVFSSEAGLVSDSCAICRLLWPSFYPCLMKLVVVNTWKPLEVSARVECGDLGGVSGVQEECYGCMEVDRFGCVVRSGWFWNALFAAGVFSHAKISMPFSNKKPVAFNWRLEATTMCCYGPIVVGAKWVELLYIWFRVENTIDLRICFATTFCAA